MPIIISAEPERIKSHTNIYHSKNRLEILDWICWLIVLFYAFFLRGLGANVFGLIKVNHYSTTFSLSSNNAFLLLTKHCKAENSKSDQASWKVAWCTEHLRSWWLKLSVHQVTMHEAKPGQYCIQCTSREKVLKHNCFKLYCIIWLRFFLPLVTETIVGSQFTMLSMLER